MSDRKTSSFDSALLWFGAAVSPAEIVTGTWFAPLGWQKGLAAVLLGHVIGGMLFFAAAYIGAATGKNAMQTVRISFGGGAALFSAANVLQLVGWTAVMIFTGAQVAAVLGGGGQILWCLLIGTAVAAWTACGSRRAGRLKGIMLAVMLAVTLWLSFGVFGSTAVAPAAGGEMSFGTAVELAAVMPLSWLPLVSDYTRNLRRPLAGTAAATAAYSLTSCWMYALGLAAALFAGQSEPAQILAAAGLGTAGLLAVVLSTVTTTYLDAFSAGVSAANLWPKAGEMRAALAVTAAGTLLAAVLPVTEYEHFLLWIGSVFAPMIAVSAADFFLLGRREAAAGTDWPALGVWAAGFVLYRFLLSAGWETDLGLTVPVMAAVAAATAVVRKLCSLRAAAGAV